MKVMQNNKSYLKGLFHFFFRHKCVLLIENLKKKKNRWCFALFRHSDKIFQKTWRLNNLINYFLDSEKCAGLIDLSNQRGLLKLSRSVPEN